MKTSKSGILITSLIGLIASNIYSGSAVSDSLEPQGKTYVFECSSGSDFVVNIGSDSTWLFRDQQSLKLVAPKGLVAYTAPGIELLITGEDAVLREVGKTTQFCQNNPSLAIWEHAKLNGVDFRAIGNEPGWSLEFIEGSRIIFISNYNTLRIERPSPEPITNEATNTTHWDTEGLSIEVSGEACQDDMSGEAFESSVKIHWNDQVLLGCGKSLH